MPELWKDGSKEMVFCPYCGEKMPAVTVDEEETPGDDTEDVTPGKKKHLYLKRRQ